MALTNTFYEAVQSGNVRRVRIMMKDSLLIDPTFTEFNAMEKAATSMSTLYDVHDGKAFVEDQSLWDDDYMDMVMVKVLSNFSHERIDHLKDIVHYLRPVTRTVSAKCDTDSKNRSGRGSYEEEKRRCQERGDYLNTKVSVGAVAGAAIGSAVALVAGATVVGVVGGAVAGAVAGGFTATIIANERNKQ